MTILSITDPTRWLAIRPAVHERATADSERFVVEASESVDTADLVRLTKAGAAAAKLAHSSRNDNAWIHFGRTGRSNPYVRKVIENAAR